MSDQLPQLRHASSRCRAGRMLLGKFSSLGHGDDQVENRWVTALEAWKQRGMNSEVSLDAELQGCKSNERWTQSPSTLTCDEEKSGLEEGEKGDCREELASSHLCARTEDGEVERKAEEGCTTAPGYGLLDDFARPKSRAVATDFSVRGLSVWQEELDSQAVAMEQARAELGRREGVLLQREASIKTKQQAIAMGVQGVHCKQRQLAKRERELEQSQVELLLRETALDVRQCAVEEEMEWLRAGRAFDNMTLLLADESFARRQQERQCEMRLKQMPTCSDCNTMSVWRDRTSGAAEQGPAKDIKGSMRGVVTWRNRFGGERSSTQPRP